MINESGVIQMMTFSIVKKIGEGRYLADDLFIIERARREKVLGAFRVKPGSCNFKNRLFRKNGRNKPS